MTSYRVPILKKDQSYTFMGQLQQETFGGLAALHALSNELRRT